MLIPFLPYSAWNERRMLPRFDESLNLLPNARRHN